MKDASALLVSISAENCKKQTLATNLKNKRSKKSKGFEDIQTIKYFNKSENEMETFITNNVVKRTFDYRKAA